MTNARKRGTSSFKFVNSKSYSSPDTQSRKAIKSHAARGSGRPKRAIAHRKPRIGSWLRDENVFCEQDNQETEAFCDLLPYAAFRSHNEPASKTKSISDIALAEARPNFRVPSFSPDITPAMLDRIYKAMSQLSKAMYPITFCSIFEVDNTTWCKYVNQDAAHQYVFPFVAETYTDLLEGRQRGPEASRLLAKILPLVRTKLEDPTEAIADSTISAIIALATVADMLNEFEVLKNHVAGLHSLVTLRGGLERLRYIELQAKCCRVDIQLAIVTGCKPVFFATGLSWDPFFARTSAGGQFSHLETTAIDTVPAFCNVSLDHRLVNIWNDAQEFCTIINLAHFTQQKIQPVLFQEIMISLQYRLLHLKNAMQPADNTSLHEMIRLCTLAFTTTVFLQIVGIETHYIRLASRIGSTFSSLRDPADIQDWKLRLWLLVVAAISVFPSPSKRTWFQAPLNNVLTRLELSSWRDFKSILKEFLWIDIIHDTEGKRMFDWCISCTSE